MLPRSRLREPAVLSLLLGLFVAPLLVPRIAGAQQRVDTTDLKNRRAKKLFVRGMTQSYLEDHEEAVSYFERALEISPGQPAVLMALAETKAARNDLTSALYYARQAREGAPDQPYYAHRLAALQREAGRVQEAAATYRTLLAKFPGYNEARLPLARLQNELNRPQAAIATYEAFVDSSRRPPPEVYTEMLDLYQRTDDAEGLERTLKTLIDRRQANRPYRRRLAEHYVQQGRLVEAIPLFEALVRETPNNPQLLSRLEMLYEETGQTEQAASLWDRFSEKSAEPGPLVARARSLFEEAQTTEDPLDSIAVRPARELLHQALAQDSTHVGALDLLAALHLETGAYAAAARLLDRALETNPRAPERWHRAATAHLRAEHPRRAVAVAEEGLLLFPGRTDLLRSLGFGHLRLNDPEAARARFQDALDRLNDAAVSRERAALQAGLGRAEALLGNPDRATDAFDTALELAPQASLPLHLYARTLADQETNLDRALTLAERAVEQAPTDPRALGTLGRVQFKRGALEEARAAFKRAVRTGHAPARVYEHFGDLHQALGNDRLAQRYWEEAADRCGTCGTGCDALQDKLDALPQS
jgi:tetratricopeptide (TPR) repeat protein